MSISQATGAFANAYGLNQATLAVTNVTIGDLRVASFQIQSTSKTITAVSGGGVTTWTQLEPAVTGGHYLTFWYGVVTSAPGTAQTITATYSSTPGVNCEIWSSELVWSGGTASWSVFAAGQLANTSSTTVTWPSLNTTATLDQAYFGHADVLETASAGSTSGFTYSAVNGNGDIALFNGTLTAGGTAYQPTASQSPAGTSSTIGAIFSASAPGAVNLTGLLASTSVVNGVLQAGSITSQLLTGKITSTSIVVGAVTSPAPPSGIMVLMLENQEYSSIIGGTGLTNAPNINALAASYPICTSYYGDSHPSLPNYISLVTGLHASVTDDNPPSSHTALSGQANLFAQLDTAGIPWTAYFESLTGNPLVDEGSTDPTGDQLYAVHHNPMAYVATSAQLAWSGSAVTGTWASKCNAYSQSAMTTYLNNSANQDAFVWVTPNMMDDMHDPVGTSANDNASIQAGDTWVNTFVTAVQGTSWYTSGGTILIIWDEAYNTTGSQVAGGFGSPAVNGGPVAFLAVSQNLQGYANQSANLTHIGVLQSIQAFYGLSALGGAGYGSITTMLEYTGSSINPSGLLPPAVPPGWVLAFFDDFTGTALNTSVWSVWDGPPGGTDGWWLPSHVKVSRSVLHLQAYQDSAGISADPTWAAEGSPVVTGGTDWVCGGVGWASGNSFPPNLIVNVAMKQAPYANLAAIAILIGASNWPPEIDFVESVNNTSTIVGFTATAHYGSGNSQVQYSSAAVDMTQWGMWGVIWTPTTISYTYNNVVWKSFTNPDQSSSDIYSLVQNMSMGLQYQTGDPGDPASDPSVTAANPMEMQVDWIQILVPGTGVYISGTPSSTSTVTGSLKAMPHLSGTAVSTSTVVGALAAKTGLSGTIVSTSTVYGALTVSAGARYLTGTIVSASTVVGSLVAKTYLAGTAASTSTVVGNLTAQTSLPTLFVGNISSTSTVTGALSIRSPITLASAHSSVSEATTAVAGGTAVTIATSNAQPVTSAKVP